MTKRSDFDPLDPFGAATRSWFEASFAAPMEIQKRGWRSIAGREHSLLIAPTGSGKTLAAFLWGIDTLTRLSPEAPPGVRVLYVSPLKALVYDVERNLRAPLVGIGLFAERLGEVIRTFSVDMRTGDTPPKERREQAKNPAEILVTTPESLYLLLGSRARETLRSVHTVIVDEIHALAPTKRGAHLSLSLERLCALTDGEPQRIGLSATVRPAGEVARFLGGDRPVTIIDASARPLLDLQVTVPVPDMENVSHAPPPPRGGPILGELAAQEGGQPRTEKGIWPAIYPELIAAIRAHRSTILFVNSRGLCERLSRRLNELAEEELVRAHHGSVSREARQEIEEALKAGRLRGIVATSSLELGIDMGAVDLVIQIESPGSVARGLQRVGRAGHQVGEVSSGRLFPKHRADLLECALIAGRMLQGEIEALQVPSNPLDVLAQQIAAICCDGPHSVAEIAAVVRRASPYRELSREVLLAVLDMLSGRYPSTEMADLRPLLNWDRSRDLLTPRRGTALLMRMNAGTIPDRGNYIVTLGTDGPRLGELDEEMVFESRPGDNILLGATTWHVEQITHDRVIVSPAPGEPGRLPFWHGEGPGRPAETGRALGAFIREVDALNREDAIEHLLAATPLSRYAAENLAAYIHEQKEQTGTLPTDRAITVERFRDELGDWRVCILSPFGARLHAPWAMALQRRLSGLSGVETQVMYTDDGIVLRLADTEELPELELLLPEPEEIEDLVTEQLGDTALFAALFRENAARSLLLPRRRADRRTPLWAQRLKSQGLLAAVRRYPSFPILLETYRQALSDVFDLPGLKELLGAIRSRRVRVNEVETESASPFARSLVFAYIAAYLYEQDAPLAERRAQALPLDRNLLRELLGQAELRELIDPEALTEIEAGLQHLTPEKKAAGPDELHDLLRRLGDLSAAEMAARSCHDPDPWLQCLERERRATEVGIAGERRWIAAMDAALYRDALGVMPPPGLPEAFLDSPENPLEQLLRRFARTRGPFLLRQAAGRFGLLPAQVEPVLRGLEDAGVLVHGELRPGGAEREWCDAEVLRRLKRLTLARLRQEAAPVESRDLALFLSEWQGLERSRSAGRLEEVIGQLEGLPLPWSALCEAILPARVAGFNPDQLDMLCATGRIVWVGSGSLGPRDGRVALYRRAQAARLVEPQTESAPPGQLHAAILDHLRSRGASFLFEIEENIRRAHPGTDKEEFQGALWDLVWAGRISNDTLAPLRSLGKPARHKSRRRVDPLAGGRWSLVEHLCDPQISPTEQTLARCEMLLERYGIVSREAAQAEEVGGGFTSLYRVLKSMEEAGRIRRGYFAEGLSGAQFACVGAIDRLRAVQPQEDIEDRTVRQPRALAAVDPANPYGALLPWPEAGGADQAAPRRVAGAWVILLAGRPILYLAPGGRQLRTFPRDGWERELEVACRALLDIPRTGRRRLLTIEKIDGVAARDSALYETLRKVGFEGNYKGLSPGPAAAGGA